MKLKIVFLSVTALFVLGAFGWLGYTTFQLTGERDALLQDLQKQEQRNRLLKKKNSQEKAKVAQCAAAKARVESRLREADNRIAVLKEEKASLAKVYKEVDGLKALLDKEKNRYKKLLAQKKDIEEARKKIVAKLDALRQTHQQKMAEYEQKTTELTSKKNQLTARLNSTNRRLDRCQDHNARLCVISGNLAAMIQEKGGGLIKEPLFQAGRIEIEKIAQEYLEKIDKLKIKKREG
ncbi:MAG: hypothetical protein KQH63_12055 [Desulfobulbaceae bacterium]|nr:hypothetical protein [Desulfobulbaceae bacterium]